MLHLCHPFLFLIFLCSSMKTVDRPAGTALAWVFPAGSNLSGTHCSRVVFSPWGCSPARALLQGKLYTSCSLLLGHFHLLWHGVLEQCGFLLHHSAPRAAPRDTAASPSSLGASPGAAGQSLLQSLEHLLPLPLHPSECLWGCFSHCLVVPLTAAKQCVFLFLKCIPQRCPHPGCRAQLRCVLGLMEPSGMGWNGSCPAQDSSSFSSQRLPCSGLCQHQIHRAQSSAGVHNG